MPQSHHRPRVLVVDDDAAAREQLSQLLSMRGWEVLQASDGAEALASLRQSGPMMVLLDLTMPGMDGWRFMDELRRDPRLRRVPVVVVSAVAHPELAHAVQGFIRKPFAAVQLFAVLDEAFAFASGRDSEPEHLLLANVLAAARFAGHLHDDLQGVLSRLQERPRASSKLIELIEQLDRGCSQMSAAVEELKQELSSELLD